jgi:hypothetical protein
MHHANGDVGVGAGQNLTDASQPSLGRLLIDESDVSVALRKK